MNRKTMMLMFSLFFYLLDAAVTKKMIQHRNHRVKRRKVKWTLPFPGIRCRKKQRKRKG
ncbi:hypothetical protein [Peribacillus frigoritolerans]|uniref:hypothetical protein n=1 Tax=Peribacillus frigoritolerans TaxID=450367 RepID=UPI0020C06A66|nr:hypothetical protein [Peribacillus frigoritolerans]